MPYKVFLLLSLLTLSVTYLTIDFELFNLAGIIEWVARGFYFASGLVIFFTLFQLIIDACKHKK